MSLSADAQIEIIIFEYLQPFELAVQTGEHTLHTYLNAVTYGNLQYMGLHKKVCKNFNVAIQFAGNAGQIDAILLLREFGATNFDGALYFAAQFGHLDAMRLCRDLGAIKFNNALMYASRMSQIDAIILLKEFGADDFQFALHCARQIIPNDPKVIAFLGSLL